MNRSHSKRFHCTVNHSAPVVKDQFGNNRKYWIGFVLWSGYSELLSLIGTSLRKALNNFDKPELVHLPASKFSSASVQYLIVVKR